MEAEVQEPNNLTMDQKQALQLDIEIIPVEDHYFMRYKANINPQYANLFINRTFILFVLELRTGMTQRGISILKRCILDFCEQALQKDLNGFGFIINGEYFTIKKPNYDAIEQILNTWMLTSKQDNYFLTLRKLRHVLEKDIYKYEKQVQFIDLVFFTSYVQIDHSLGVKKRSYINQLNEHTKDCFHQVDRIHSLLNRQMKNYNAHIIGLQKRGLKDEDYSLADRDLFNRIHTRLGKITSLILLYWIEDESPSVVVKAQQETYHPDSFTKLAQGFKAVSSSVLSASLSFLIEVPIVTKEQKQQYLRQVFWSSDLARYQPQFISFLPKLKISLQQIYNKQIKIHSERIQQTLQKNQLPKEDQPIQHLCKIRSQYKQLQSEPAQTQIYYKTTLYNQVLNNICQQLKQQIISFIRIYDGNNKSHLQMKVDEGKQQSLKEKIFYIENKAKQIYQQIFNCKIFQTQNQLQCKTKRKAFQMYSSLKRKLDVVQQVLMNINKKQINNDQIGKICKAVTFWNVRNSLKNKLIRRVNLNPKMIDQTYAKIHQIVSNNNFTSLETNNKEAKHAIGNCIRSNINFATALRKEDCLAIMIQIQRPDTAIADPGRIKVRQISPFAISVSNFFNVYHYGIDIFGQLDEEKGGQWVRQYAKLQKDNYQEMWDYWGLVQKKYTVTALVPVYLCKQHWDIAKLLMKPCLGWTATGQPLGYTFAQTQTIPFLVLSFSIRKVQQITYLIEQLQNKFLKSQFKVTQYSILERQIQNKKLLRKRFRDICWVLEQTCFQIMKDMSSEAFEQKLSEIVIQKYRNYIEIPIQRTIDVISNNSAFLAQLYCVIKLNLLKTPQQQQFHQFFKRLIQQELRRQTDGWNEEQAQDKFINKLLNTEVQKMDVPEYFILGSEYFDKFEQLKNGYKVHQTYFQITRNQLAMMLTKNGKFNETQRMMLIQYKRLYQNRVMWMWYVRFKLYTQMQRVYIHKWKCIDLHNSYMLFTMIIQNKKQRKNLKRREAILRSEYVDPFNQQKSRQFLQMQFFRLRGKKQNLNIKILNNKKYGNAASTFIYTKSFQEAAGTLINFDIGQHCRIFFSQMQKGDGIRMEQKLRMMMVGQYKDIQLFKGWKMSKKNNNKLRKVYPLLFMKFGYMF